MYNDFDLFWKNYDSIAGHGCKSNPKTCLERTSFVVLTVRCTVGYKVCKSADTKKSTFFKNLNFFTENTEFVTDIKSVEMVAKSSFKKY